MTAADYILFAYETLRTMFYARIYVLSYCAILWTFDRSDSKHSRQFVNFFSPAIGITLEETCGVVGSIVLHLFCVETMIFLLHVKNYKVKT